MGPFCFLGFLYPHLFPDFEITPVLIGFGHC